MFYLTYICKFFPFRALPNTYPPMSVNIQTTIIKYKNIFCFFILLMKILIIKKFKFAKYKIRKIEII